MITNLIFTYRQVSESGSFQFFTRRLVIRLSVASASTPRRPFTEAKKRSEVPTLFEEGVTVLLCILLISNY